MSSPLLSVVIPVAYRRTGLDRCLRSVLDSMKGIPLNWDLTIKDSTEDGVTMSPWFEAEGFFFGDRLQLRRDVQREMHDSWNECVRTTTGQYVHILHDDDYIRPGFYLSVWPHLQSGASAVATGYEVEDDRGVAMFENRIKRGGGRIVLNDLIGGNPLVPSCVVFSRAAYGSAGGFPRLGCSDWEMWLAIAKMALNDPWVVVPEFLVRQTRGPDSQEGRDGRILTCQKIVETILKWESKLQKRMPARDVYLRQFVGEAILTNDVELFKTALSLQ